MAQVFPTKSNLMAQKRSLALASQGYDLMDRKRNILVREMMQLIDRAAVIQDEIATAYSSAYKTLQRANITLGVVGEFAKTVPVETGLKLDYRSVMGVELPIVKMEESAPGLYYGLDSTIEAEGYDQILVLYNFQTFIADNRVVYINRPTTLETQAE